MKIGRERLRELLAKHKVTFQRTKTWKETNDLERDGKLDRIEHVLEHHLDRCFAFGRVRSPWPSTPSGAAAGRRRRSPSGCGPTYPKNRGVRQFHAVYSLGEDTMWGVCRAKKSIANTLAGIKTCRAARPDGEMIYVILDNLSAHEANKIKAWCPTLPLQLHGAVALERGHLIEHLYRETRAARIYEGTSEIQREIIARELLADR